MDDDRDISNIIPKIEGLTVDEIDYAFQMSAALIRQMNQVFFHRPPGVRPIAITAAIADTLDTFTQIYEHDDEPPRTSPEPFPIMARMGLSDDEKDYATAAFNAVCKLAAEMMNDCPPGVGSASVTAGVAEALATIHATRK